MWLRCVQVNPYTWEFRDKGIYNNDYIERYRSVGLNRDSAPPHIYGIASQAYFGGLLADTPKAQSVIVRS